MQQEEEAKTGQGGNKSNSADSQTNSQLNKWKQEAPDEYGEYIDMDMEDECVSDVESES